MDLCSIASGSSGNCIYAGTDSTSILVDVGVSGKRITSSLAEIDRKGEEIDGILVTHEHSDHIQGLGVLARKFHIPVYGTRGTINYILGCGKLGKLDESLFHVINTDEGFTIGDMDIMPFRISHDAAEPCGYRLSDGKSSLAVATDMGEYDEYTVEHLRGLDAVLLESNHDVNMLEVGPYPYPLKRRILGKRGHLSNEVAGHLLCEVLHDQMKKVFLGHLSKENNYEALALATVRSEVTLGDTPYTADDFDISVAPRDQRSALITV